METLQRSVMLLKPGDSRLIEPGKSGGSLKLLAKGGGFDISFKADCIKDGDFFLYLFTKDGKELCAGDVSGGTLSSSIAGVPLESITGAAVVARDLGGSHSFCLKSTGPDWPALIERFKLRRAPRAELKAAPPSAAPLHAGSAAPSESAPPVAPPYTDFPARPPMQRYMDYQPDIAHTQPPYDDYRMEASHLRADIGYEPEAAPPRPAYEYAPEVYEALQPQYGNYAQEYIPAPAQNAGGAEADDIPAEPAELKSREGFEEESCDACPHAVRESNINPFPAVFPNSEWVKISYPGPTGWWHYISGKIYKGGALAAKVLGVPGEYGMAPPIWLEGFGTYLRCFTGDARGYWLMFQDAETGEVLDMGLSPHGG